jgi:protein gp37
MAKLPAPNQWGCDWPLFNVWLGVSCEDQKRADERIPHLLQTPSAVRLLSAEPLLGAIDLRMVPHFPGQGVDGRWLDWIIAGGESGPKARPMHPDWARSLRDQCAAAGVPFFFKQWGEWISAEAPGRSDEIGVLMQDGEFLRGPRTLDRPGEDGWIIKRLGKHRTGRLLDGREHNDMPAVAVDAGTVTARVERTPR